MESGGNMKDESNNKFNQNNTNIYILKLRGESFELSQQMKWYRNVTIPTGKTSNV